MNIIRSQAVARRADRVLHYNRLSSNLLAIVAK